MQICDDDIEKVQKIYDNMISSLDEVLVGQKNVKKAVASAMLCDTNSKVLLSGDTGMGKTTLTKFLSSSFNWERISVVSDMLPSEIQEQLKDNRELNFLIVDEFNRASGRLQSAFIEFFAEKQMSINGKTYSFEDFYVFATENLTDVTGIFNIPQAVYDRFDVNIYFDHLTEDERDKILFENFEPKIISHIKKEDLNFTKDAVNRFQMDEDDKNIMREFFRKIDEITINKHRLFLEDHIRADKFMIRLAKLMAMASGRNYILPVDIVDFIDYVYRHRINQSFLRIEDDSVTDNFYELKEKVLKLQKKRKIR